MTYLKTYYIFKINIIMNAINVDYENLDAIVDSGSA